MITVRYEWLHLQPDDRLLDLGCGLGRHAFEAARRGAHVVACDLSDAELKDVRATFAAMSDAGQIDERVSTAVANGDARRLPFADASFDRVIASEVLEHVDNDGRALRELARVLRPGGTLAVTVPAFASERVCWWLSGEYHAPAVSGGHVRVYRLRDLRAKLRVAGLLPGRTHHAHALHTPYWWLRCAVGPHNEGHRAVVLYRKMLEWDIVRRPFVTRAADRVLNPVIGKSVVVYATKPR